MKSKQMLYIVGGAIVLLLIIVIVVMTSSGPGDSSDGPITELPDHQFESWDQPFNNPDLSGTADGIFSEGITLTYDQLMDMARRGEINLVSELWRMRRKCPEDMERYQCNLLLRQYIMDNFSPPDNERLAELLTKYLKYEEEMSAFRVPENTSLAEQYELIRQKRRELFSNDEARLVFGLEEAKYDFSRAFQDFREETKGMSGDERVAAYENLRKEVYGDYYEAMMKRQEPFQAFEVEKDLRNDEWAEMGSEAQIAETRALREKYFGPEGAERMAEVDTMLAEEAEQNEALRKAEEDFLRNNPELSAEEKEKRLHDIRVQHLGEDAAAAYERREALRRARENP